MNLSTVADLEVTDKRVLVRADLDVPISKVRDEITGKTDLKVLDETRIKEVIPTIRLLLERKCRYVVVMGHIGHETGEKAVTTSCVSGVFGRLLGGEKVSFWEEAIREGSLNPDPERDGRLELLENLRFYEGEEKNDDGFSRTLADFGDIYVDESFATAHRKHASIVGVPRVMREEGKQVAAGLRFFQEVEILGKVLREPRRPLVVVVGGAKLESKLPVISKMESWADKVLVGGRLPSEIAAENMKFSEKVIVASLATSGRDIDQRSKTLFLKEIQSAGTVVWGGPMGIFEEEGNDFGTREIAEAIAGCRAYKIAGGGDTEAAIRKFGLFEKFDWVSIGGGAMLEFLASGTLPGIEALTG